MGIIRKEIRRGVARWIIDIRYRGKDGKRRRFRRDAQVQSRGAAEAEARRLLTQLAETGSLEVSSNERDSEAPITVEEAIQHFLLVEMPKKKPSTQRGYLAILDSEIRPRFAERPIGDLNKDLFLRLDTELAESGLSASSRRNILVVLRRVLGSVVDAGWLEHLPPLPRLPRVGRKVARAMTWEESVAILEHGTDAFRLGALLARDAGLRASEVRGLRWTDVDLNARTLTVRRAICQGVEAAPKSGHERVIRNPSSNGGSGLA